jgi:ABC-type multidrug transport system ATPase subunit
MRPGRPGLWWAVRLPDAASTNLRSRNIPGARFRAGRPANPGRHSRSSLAPTAARILLDPRARGGRDRRRRLIRALPDGFDTDVRKRGGRLSAGQRQLVGFARAFLADPAVLILDEATASLDIPAEPAVQQALRTVLKGRTAVIIAHRLSTVAIADRVLVMEGGRIVEDGSPESLIAGTGAYARLHDAWRESLV